MGTLQLTLKAPAATLPLQRADIASRITAPIRNLLVKKGDEVKANQVLAILDGKEMSNYILTWDVLQQQQAELRANITKAEKELEQLKNANGSNDGEHARNLERAKNLATSLLTQQLPQNESAVALARNPQPAQRRHYGAVPVSRRYRQAGQPSIYRNGLCLP